MHEINKVMLYNTIPNIGINLGINLLGTCLHLIKIIIKQIKDI